MKLNVNDLRDLCLGHELDNGVMEVEIDCSKWRNTYPQLTEYRVEVTSPEGIVYFAKTEMRGDVLYWPITRLDTAADGLGKYQIVATGPDDARKTSDHRTLMIRHTMPGTAQGEVPDPSKPWTDQVMEAADRAEQAAKRAEEIANGVTPGGGGNVGIATEDTPGVVIVGSNLSIDADGRLSVVTADVVEQDNTRPITSAAVHTTVGNINSLLETI